MQDNLIKDDKEPVIGYIFAIIIGVIALCISIKIFYTIRIKRYQACCDNIPTEEWFSEKIEDELLTHEFEIIETQSVDEGKVVLLVKVHYNDEYTYYRILFKVEAKNASAWWKLERYV